MLIVIVDTPAIPGHLEHNRGGIVGCEAQLEMISVQWP